MEAPSWGVFLEKFVSLNIASIEPVLADSPFCRQTFAAERQ